MHHKNHFISIILCISLERRKERNNITIYIIAPYLQLLPMNCMRVDVCCVQFRIDFYIKC